MNTSQNTLFPALREIGIDVDGTITRFMNNSELYLNFIKRFPDEDRITPIHEAIAEKDYGKLLSAAHKLKGVAANLGMTALSSKASEIVTKIRSEFYEGFEDDAAMLEQLSDQVCNAIRSNV